MYLTSNEAMNLLRVSRTQLYRLIDAGKLKAYKPAGRLIFAESELDRFIKQGAVQPKEQVFHSPRRRKNSKPNSEYMPGVKCVSLAK